jgi:hypothetical protein
MIRPHIVVPLALVLLLATGCQQDIARPSCPVESVQRVRPEVRAVAFAYGDGPVFVGLGTGDGMVHYRVDTKKRGGWYYYKTLWAIAPGYTGSVVITGRQVGGSNALLRFNAGAGFPGQPQRELRFPADDSGKWRYGPSDTLIRTAGCYVFRVEGADLEQDIAFKATD